MRPYMVSMIPEQDLFLFQEIERVVQKMPDVDLGKDEEGMRILVSCHMVVRAITRLFPEVARKDGYFTKNAKKGIRHSWLVIKRNPNLLIDPYPVALVGGPIMVHCGFFTVPWDSLYIAARLSDLGGSQFRRHVAQVTRAMRGAMAKSSSP